MTAIQAQGDLPSALACVSKLVGAKPEAFLSGDDEIYAATLDAVKYVFDLSLKQEQLLQTSVAELLRSDDSSYVQPQTRLQTKAAAKRKRSPSPPPFKDEEIWKLTPLESLYVEGMNDDQVWAQLELKTATLSDVLKAVLGEEVDEDDIENDESLDDSNDEGPKDVEDLEGLDSMDVMDEDEDDDYSEDSDVNQGGDEDEDLGEDIAELRDPSDEESESADEDDIDLDRSTRPQKRRRISSDIQGQPRGGHPILDDGFFSLAEFNAETEEAEARNVSKGRLSQDDDDDEDSEVEVDLFATVDDVPENAFEEDLEDGEPYYKDFFDDPPSRKTKIVTDKVNSLLETPNSKSRVRFHDEVRVKTIKSRGKGNAVASIRNGFVLEEEDDSDEFGEQGEQESDEDDFSDMSMITDHDEAPKSKEEEKSTKDDGTHEIIERLKDDLFAEDKELTSRDRSTYEVRQAEITAQIAKFEAENVNPKEWTLMGEATARSRQVNSLLEEDLEFERIMKVVPVVTEESVSSLEEIIKKRILENRFDDVVRKRAADDKPFLPSRLFELNDKKSTQSLAQVYENEYAAAASGTGIDARDDKLEKEHKELESLWDNICYKLDALCNAHFTPKQPKATILSISNIPAATLESALPTTKSTTTRLAPEEVFTAPSEPRSRDELTSQEKRAQRNKRRKARKKARDQIAAVADKFARTQKGKIAIGAIKREKDKALKSVVKTGKGVTVVGKKSTDLSRQSKEKKLNAPIDGKKLKL